MKKIHVAVFVGVIVSVVVLFVQLNTCRPGDPECHPSRSELIKLLKNRSFQKLDKQLMAYQEAYEAGRVDETTVERAYLAFGNTDPSLEPLLKDWVLDSKGYPARAALSIYYEYVGWQVRGGKYSRETPKNQMRSMEEYFEKARLLAEEALELNGELLFIYARLMGMDRGLGDREAFINHAKLGLDIDPVSYLIHYKTMFGLQPKWGGSLDAIQSYIQYLEALIPSNPQLAFLRGFQEYVKGDSLGRERECEEALPHLMSALSQGEHYLYFQEVAFMYACLSDYENALANINKALSFYPESSDRLARKGYYLYRLNRFNEALDVLSQAINYDGYHIKALNNRARIYYKQKKWELALDDLRKATYYRDTSHISQRYLGYVYYYKKDYKNATKHLELVNAFKPGYVNDIYYLMASKWHLKDCDFVMDAHSYLELCKEKNVCSKSRVEWTKGALSTLKNHGLCLQELGG